MNERVVLCFLHTAQVQFHAACVWLSVQQQVRVILFPSTFRHDRFQELTADVPEHTRSLATYSLLSPALAAATLKTASWRSFHTSNMFMFSLLSCCISCLYTVWGQHQFTTSHTRHAPAHVREKRCNSHRISNVTTWIQILLHVDLVRVSLTSVSCLSMYVTDPLQPRVTLAGNHTSTSGWR